MPWTLTRPHVRSFSCCVHVLLQNETEPVREWISFWKPNATISIVDHFNAYPKTGIPPQVRIFV